MNINVCGLSYKTAPLKIREKLSFDDTEQKVALLEIKKIPFVNECVILSTCNRTEAYIYSESGAFDNGKVEKVLCDIKKLDVYDFKKYIYFYNNTSAVRHIFNVAAGLESMVLGEDQILGQFKDAYALSLKTGTSACVLNTLMRQAITAAKKIKTCAGEKKNAVSIASLAVEFIEGLFEGRIHNKTVLLIGTGRIGKIALEELSNRNTGKIYATSRKHNGYGELPGTYKNMHIIEYDRRYSFINECDAVISATTSPHYTVTMDMLDHYLFDKDKIMIFMDLAVPRDIDPDIALLPGIKYYNMDSLKEITGCDDIKEYTDISLCEKIINESIFEYEKWYKFRKILPVIREIQQGLDMMVEKKVNYDVLKLNSKSAEERELIKKTITGIIDEISNKLLYGVKDYLNEDEIEAYYGCLKDAVRKKAVL